MTDRDLLAREILELVVPEVDELAQHYNVGIREAAHAIRAGSPAPAAPVMWTDREFAQYRRSQIAELRPYKLGDSLSDRVSISASDREAGSPKLGDMIARNPKNHDDQWLVAAAYFADNFEPVHAAPVVWTDEQFDEAERAFRHTTGSIRDALRAALEAAAQVQQTIADDESRT